MADIDKDGRFRTELRRQGAGAAGAAGAFPNLLGQRFQRHCRGYGDEHPAAQPSDVLDACLGVAAQSADPRIERSIQIRAPDFPTAGIISSVGRAQGYRTGAWPLRDARRTSISRIWRRAQAIIVDRASYQVNKANAAGENRASANWCGQENRRHFRPARRSDKSGMRAVIELKRGEVPEIVLNNLFQDDADAGQSFGMNMVALVDGQPRLLNLKRFVECSCAIAAKWSRAVRYST